MRNALILLAVVAAIILIAGGFNNGVVFDVDYMVGTVSSVSLFWVSAVIAAVVFVAGLAASWFALSGAAGGRRKLEAELQSTYERLRQTEREAAEARSAAAAAEAAAAKAAASAAPASVVEATVVAEREDVTVVADEAPTLVESEPETVVIAEDVTVVAGEDETAVIEQVAEEAESASATTDGPAEAPEGPAVEQTAVTQAGGTPASGAAPEAAEEDEGAAAADAAAPEPEDSGDTRS